MASVQRLMMYVTPTFVLNILCRICPKTVIGLLCHWVNEKNPDLEERGLAKRRINPVPVAKKMSKLSNLSILYLLKQDASLWRLFLPGVGIIPFPDLPAILLELIFELGGEKGRKKVNEIIAKCRLTLGGRKQGEILENFKTDTVLDLFETLPPMDVIMRLRFSKPEAVAIWLTHWDLRMKELNKPPKSAYWIARIPGERAFQIEELMRGLEFRTKYENVGRIRS